MKSIAVMALLGSVSAVKFLGDEAPVWDNSQLMKSAREMSEGDQKFARFMAFEEKRKEGKDDYSRNGPLEFVQEHEKENKKMEQPRAPASQPPMQAAPGTAPATQKKEVFYFDGEDMVKRDAMVQLEDITDKENAEYPFPHVHTEDHEDVDPITRLPVNPVKGYAQKSFIQLQDITDKENAEYPFPHVHTEDGQDVDPITRLPVNPVKGYAQNSFMQLQDITDKENAEYPFPHVHTEEHEDVDPITRLPVNPVKGYVQLDNGMIQVIAQ